jgi:hypothetical protein
VTLLILVSFALLVGGGVLVVTFIVGSTALAAGALVYVGHGFAFLLGIQFRWGLVLSCALLVLGCGVAAIVHDLRLEVTPPQAPPREHH